MALTTRALMMRIDNYISDARKRFANNPYITIHGHVNPKTNKPEPLKVYFDINIPHYVERNGTPVLVSGQKGACVSYSPQHPKERPTVTTPETIVSVHSWGESKKLCLYTLYVPERYSLTRELEKVLLLAANCPESINFKSMCPPMSNYKEWTETGLRNGTLPTVKKDKLLGKVNPPRRRSVAGLRGLA